MSDQVCSSTCEPAAFALAAYRRALSSSISDVLAWISIGGKSARLPSRGDATGLVGEIRKAASVAHQITGFGIFDRPPKTGPSIGSVEILLRLLGAERVRSVDGENATAPFAWRRPLSRIQASRPSVWLPPAESPATRMNDASPAPSGPLSTSQV